jgi:1-acyl-sn-glycerol-3-phosphate acyltransferase
MKKAVLYTLMKPWVQATMNSFYSHYSVNNVEKLPNKAPVILAPNHQNAFMDPIGVSCRLRAQTSYLVRADVFKSKAVSKFLHALRLMPIYRQRDGVDNLEKNEEIFDYCYQLLKANNAIILFPEGNHNNKKMLRPLKKGASRIAFGAETKYNFEVGVQVVPVGLNYSNHTNMGAELLINIGDPIDVRDYKDIYLENEALGLLALKDELHKRMSGLILNIENKELYDIIDAVHPMARTMMKEKMGFPPEHNQVNHFKVDQIVVNALQAQHEIDPTKTNVLKEEVEEYTKGLKLNKFRDHLFEVPKHKGLFWEALFLLLFSPMWLFGLINSYLPWKIPDVIVQKKVKDIHFHSSIKMALSMFLFPIFWGIQSLVVCLVVPHWELGLLYALMLPVGGQFALGYWRMFKKFRARVRYNSMRQTPALATLQQLRKSIIDRTSVIVDQSS